MTMMHANAWTGLSQTPKTKQDNICNLLTFSGTYRQIDVLYWHPLIQEVSTPYGN